MKDHKFIPIEGTSPKVYMVNCLTLFNKTGNEDDIGQFSTEIWRKGRAKQDYCPCCEKYLKEVSE